MAEPKQISPWVWLVLVFSLLLGIFMVSYHLMERQRRNNPEVVRLRRVQLERGVTFDEPDELRIRKRTVIVAVSELCMACESSRPFHLEVVRRAKDLRLRLIMLVPESSQLLNLWGDGVEVRKVPFEKLGIMKPPTLMIVDAEGKITDLWAGRMTTHEEQIALSRLSGALDPLPYLDGNLSEAAWLHLKDHYGGVLLDLREREDFVVNHSKNAINIPLDELESRARHELDQTKPIVIDCTRVVEAKCRIARAILAMEGFESVATLNLGLMASQCLVGVGQ